MELKRYLKRCTYPACGEYTEHTTTYKGVKSYIEYDTDDGTIWINEQHFKRICINCGYE